MAEPVGIFVSHAHEDNAWCRTFVEALRQGGANVWYDEHNLGYGVSGEEIEHELQTRPIFIVILSPASVGKPWVRRETDAAIGLQDRGPQRIILPVVAEKTDIPLLWRTFKRVSGPGDTGLGATEAAERVIHALGSYTAYTSRELYSSPASHGSSASSGTALPAALLTILIVASAIIALVSRSLLGNGSKPITLPKLPSVTLPSIPAVPIWSWYVVLALVPLLVAVSLIRYYYLEIRVDYYRTTSDGSHQHRRSRQLDQAVLARVIPRQQEKVVCTAYYPKIVEPNTHQPLLTYITLDSPDALEATVQDAVRRLPAEGNAFQMSAIPARHTIRRTTTVTLIPDIPGFQCSPTTATFRWENNVHSSQFDIIGNSAQPNTEIQGWVHICHTRALVPLADIPITFTVQEPKHVVDIPDKYHCTQTSNYRSVFISYAHTDSLVVKWCKKQLERWTDDAYLIDSDELHSGTDWKQWIESTISKADVFQLYWSRHAAGSEWVQNEVSFAMAKVAQNPCFIHPRYWSAKLYPLPPALGHVHASRLYLPFWLRIALSVRQAYLRS